MLILLGTLHTRSTLSTLTTLLDYIRIQWQATTTTITHTLSLNNGDKTKICLFLIFLIWSKECRFFTSGWTTNLQRLPIKKYVIDGL
jgi:hypothetical protein